MWLLCLSYAGKVKSAGKLMGKDMAINGLTFINGTSSTSISLGSYGNSMTFAAGIQFYLSENTALTFKSSLSPNLDNSLNTISLSFAL
jgi:hypothetical protein